MFGKKSTDALVVGAGPVGLFAALQLARQGVAVQIADKERRTGTHSYALALHPGSMRILDECGLLSGVLEDALHVRTIALYDGSERRAELRVSDLKEDYSFVAVMRQSGLESQMEQALQEAKVDVLWNHGVADVLLHEDRVQVTLDKYTQDSVGYAIPHTEWVVGKTRELDYPFVIGTDGVRSTVRRRLDIEFPQVGKSLDFAVFEFKTDADLGDEMHLVFDGESTNVCWPLPDGYCRWSFQIPHDRALELERQKERHYGEVGGGRFPILDEKHLHTFLEQRAPWFKGSVEHIPWRMVVRFASRLAESFGRGRVWLAGDAGHATGPAGVQSMNVGLREARDLANQAVRFLSGGARIDDFATYESERQSEWRKLLGLAGGLTTAPDVDPWVATLRDGLVPCIPASADNLGQLLAQVGLRF